MTDASMHFKLLVPAEVRLDITIKQLNIEAMDGARTFLPRHQDFFTALPAGILSCKVLEDGVREDGEQEVTERFVAIDHGLLVKCAKEITLTAHHAILSDNLADLRARVHEEFIDVDEQQKLARTALARLEAGAIRQFINLEHLRHG